MRILIWERALKAKILKSGAAVAKDYLIEKEIKALERIVSMYLDYAENQAASMKMVDWVNKLEAFLQFNEYEILTDGGKVSHEVAKRLAEQEYEKFRITQDRLYESDFDREVKRLTSRSRSVKVKRKK